MGAKAARNDTKQKGGHMNKKQAYQCVKCGKTVEATGGKPEVSDCCAEPLKIVDLPFCTTAPSAEHARATNEDEPCDDGSAGNA
jgi:transposase-like protein